MKKLLYFTIGLSLVLTACSSDDDFSKWITPPSNGAEMTLQGGPGADQAENTVFVDFSTNTQESIKRLSWHLGFNCGSEFGVFLNSTSIGRATPAVGIELQTVLSEAQLAPYATTLSMAMGESSASMDIVDSFDKSIAGTVIKEGKVYLYRNEDSNLGFYKIKVSQKDKNTYTLAYAPSNSAEVSSVDITKDPTYTQIAYSLTEKKTLKAEKENWDILWGRNTYESAMAPGMPSAMADIIFINTKAGVKAAMVMEGDIAYAEYAEKDINLSSFSSEVGIIGDTWRGLVSMVMAVKSDRYYVIKDEANNIYKLRFLAVGGSSDGATRGYPQLEFELVKTAQL